ncbi:MAG: hypothetical protein V1695_03325 [Candidatus Uhrbacteria bacterium]
MINEVNRQGNIRIRERAQESLRQELEEARQRYGDDVDHIAHIHIGFFILSSLRRGLPDFFDGVIRDALRIRRSNHPEDWDCTSVPWKVVSSGNNGDIVLTFEDDQVRIQYFGDLEIHSKSWIERRYPCGNRVKDRTLRVDMTTPLDPYVHEIKNHDFHRAMDNINSGHNPWA